MHELREAGAAKQWLNVLSQPRRGWELMMLPPTRTSRCRRRKETEGLRSWRESRVRWVHISAKLLGRAGSTTLQRCTWCTCSCLYAWVWADWGAWSNYNPSILFQDGSYLSELLLEKGYTVCVHYCWLHLHKVYREVLDFVSIHAFIEYFVQTHTDSDTRYATFSLGKF